MRLSLSLLYLLSACGDDGKNAVPDAPIVADAAPCTGGHVIYLNRGGGVFGPGPDDAISNSTRIADGMDRSLAPFPYGDASWASIKTCIEQGLAPFHASITDVDPGNRPHHEIVFTTKYWGPNADLVASNSSMNCPPAGLPGNGVAFVFMQQVGDEPALACELALSQLASEIAGLDHSLDCHDHLDVFQTPCGPKSYVDAQVMCGDTDPRACQCGGVSQNSFRSMSAALCR